MRRISIGLGWQNRDGIDDFVERAKVADDSGVWAIFSGENWRREAFTPLVVLARETHNVQLGTSIVNTYSRAPATLAQHFATLDEVSDGRAIIGLGSSSANVTEHFSGVPFGRPLARMREYIDIINMLIAGAPLRYEGHYFKLTRGFRLDMDLPREHIPIYIASLGPKAVKQTAEIADGWMPAQIPRSRWQRLAGAFYDHAGEAGRDPSTLTIRSPSSITVTDDPEAVYGKVGGTVAFYIARMGDFYYDHFVRMGYEEMSNAIRAAWTEGGADAAAALVPEDLRRELACAGSAEECAEWMDALEEAGFNAHGVSVSEPDPRKRAGVYRTLVG